MIVAGKLFIALVVGWTILFAVYLVHKFIETILYKFTRYNDWDSKMLAWVIMVLSFLATIIGLAILYITGDGI